MVFVLPEPIIDTAAALRDLERDAPKHTKPVLLQAATELERHKQTAADAVIALDEACKLRIGQMDSISRAEEISRSIRMTMRSVADKLR